MRSLRISWIGRIALLALSIGGGADLLLAQYPGHIDTQEKKSVTSTLRSIAVLEWTGDRNRPSATRLVPVSLFDGEHLQDAGLYLARPVPLALDSGTEYEVESSGVPQGWFDLDGARQVGQDWFGFGKWKAYVPPAPKKPKTAHQQVTVVGGKPGDDRPHFVRREESTDKSATPGADTSTKNSSAGSPSTPATSEPVDPNRPRLRRRAEENAVNAEAAANAPETPSATPDADRPKLAHGKPSNLKDQPRPLELTPAALGQTIAVSDAERVGHQSFAYDWSSPTEADEARKQVEAEAVRRLQAASPASTPHPPASAARSHSTAAGARHRTAAPNTAAPADMLTDVQFHAFALTSGGGATLVMTAREAAGTRSIALIAAEDIYGKTQVLWSSITDDLHLDVTPRMTLIDAVDPRGDGRADLLFEQRNATDRRFVLLSVGATSAEQVFATDPLPLHPVAAPAGEQSGD